MWNKIKNLWKSEKEIPSIEDANAALDNLLNKNLYNPKIRMGVEFWKEYFKIKELEQKLKDHIYSDNNVKIHNDYIYLWIIEHPVDEYFNWSSYREIELRLECSWYNGKCTNILSNELKNIIYDNIIIPTNTKVKIITNCDNCHRIYTKDQILQVAKKYARCINKCIPITPSNIKLIKLNDVSAYDFALDELEHIEYLDPNNFNNGE